MFSFGISCMEVTLVPLKVEFHFFFHLKDNFEMSFWLIKSGLQLPRTLFFFPSPNHRIIGRAVSEARGLPHPAVSAGHTPSIWLCSVRSAARGAWVQPAPALRPRGSAARPPSGCCDVSMAATRIKLWPASASEAPGQGQDCLRTGRRGRRCGWGLGAQFHFVACGAVG